MRPRPWLALFVGFALYGAAGGCRGATQITVELTTDVKCDDVRGTTLTVGELDGLDEHAITTQTTACDPATGRIGSIVVVPSGENDATIAFRAVLGLGRDPTSCVAPSYGPGCVVARRALRFVPHETLTLPVFLAAICSGVACGETETCVQGACKSATIADPSTCASEIGCGEDTLPPGTGSGADAGPDATPPPPPPPPPPIDSGMDAGTLAATSPVALGTSTVADGTGDPSQSHVVYAKGEARWWLFWLDPAAPMSLATRSSTDFVTWTDGPALALPYGHGSIGRNFAARSVSIGGKDVIHLSLGFRVSAQDHRRWHARAIASAGTLAFDTPVEVDTCSGALSGDEVEPDGASVVVADDGHVTDLSGWTFWPATPGIGNAHAWRATGTDTGASFAETWNAEDDVQRVTTFVHGRAGAALGGANVLYLWDAGDAADPTNVAWSAWNGAAWSAPGTVFTTPAPQDANDWSMYRRSGTDVHVVRRTLAGGFEHMRFASGAWTAGVAVPAFAGLARGGVFLGASGSDLVLVSLAADGTIGATRWDGTSWAPWKTIVATNATRAFLSGTVTASGRTALVWTETMGSTFAVEGALIVP
jgi:hypothetical protein